MPEPTGEYEPSGEVLFSAGQSASFNSVRVRGPRVNLSRHTDDSWSGELDGKPFDVSVSASAARGVGLTLALDENDAKGFKVEGMWRGRRVRYELLVDKIAVRSDAGNFDMKRDPTSASGTVGELELKGEAGTLPAAWPQTAFALLALFH
jgi:hypothetical protein